MHGNGLILAYSCSFLLILASPILLLLAQLLHSNSLQRIEAKEAKEAQRGKII